MEQYEIQSLKHKLGVQAKQIIADGLNFSFKNGKTLCPLHAEDTPSMAWYDDGYTYKCFGCDGKIDIFEFYKMQGMTFAEAVQEVKRLTGTGETYTAKPQQKKTVMPIVKDRNLSDDAVAYMAKRKIAYETLKAWRVTETDFKGKPVYCFNYYDEKDQKPYVSYRGIGKNGSKGGCEANTKPILWGMWHIDKSKPILITEGQPDAMAVWQAGYKNVVSVPNGSNNFNWIDNCWDWLQDVKEFIVWADDDQPGHEMAKKIRERLKRVTIIYADRKDANEVLYFDGPEKVMEVIEKALQQTPPGIINVAQLEYQTRMKEEETIETGIREYDKYIEDWKMAELTVIFGRNNEGKTTLISQIIAHNIEKRQKVFMYSGEMSDQKIQDWLYRQIVGLESDSYRVIMTKYGNRKELRPDVVEKIKRWHDGYLYMFDRKRNDLKKNPNSFFNVMEMAHNRYGVKLFVIDNLMAALEENADSLYSDQANFVQACKDFSIKNNCHVVLLCHPNKIKGEIQEAAKANLEKNDISGTGNISNKADNILAVERIWSDDEFYDVVISSLKDRLVGQRKKFLMNFNLDCNRFYSQETPLDKEYSWRKHDTFQGFNLTFDDIDLDDVPEFE